MTLKIIRDTAKGTLRSDKKSEEGGIDYRQVVAFRHVAHDRDEVSELEEEILVALANMHGWCVIITTI